MKIRNMPISKIIPYEQNPRVNDHIIDNLAQVIQQVGWRQPIVVDEDMVILVGHARHKAATRLKLNKVPVHIATGLTEPQKMIYRLADNRVGELSSWDYSKLRGELVDISTLDDLEVGLTGFEKIMIDNLLDSGEATTNTTEEWAGMPDFEQRDMAYKSIVVNFKSEEDWHKFFKLIDQAYTSKTRFVWIPKQEDFDSTTVQYE
jgi:hypothetical protein